MRKLLFIFLLFTFTIKGENLDSLKKALTNAPSKTQLSIIIKICDFYQSTNSDSLLVYSQKGLNISSRMNSENFIADFLNFLGISYYNLGNNVKALSYYIKAENIYNKLKLYDGQFMAINNIGLIYQSEGLINKAFQKFFELEEKSTQNENKKYTSIAYNNLGILYYSIDKKDSSIYYWKKSLAINLDLNNAARIIENLNNIGVLYQEQNKFNDAMQYFVRYLNYSKLLKQQKDLIASYHNIGVLYNDMGNFIVATQYLDSAILASYEIKDFENLVDIYSSYADIHSERKNYEKAFQAIQLKFQYQDSLLLQDKNNAFAEMSTKYETEKKVAENKQLKAEGERQKILNIAISIGLILVIGLAFFVYRSYAIKKKANIKLEAQNIEIKEQKHVIEEKQKEILDSINYAKRIQYTLLAHEEFLQSHIPSHFVLFKPKDIVSGDFYWAAKHNNNFYLAVCDSTGHGVPGAFMSLLSIGFLSEAINEKDIEEPGDILNYVRQRLIDNISKEGQKDGFDGILIKIPEINSISSKQKIEISYAAANNAPILVSNGTFQELHKDKMPVGLGIKEDSFLTKKITLHKNDWLYMYTDGYADQFGGPKGKKFKYRPLNELILKNADKSPEEQKELLMANFNNWLGELEQVDDVCLIGFKI
ncbi:MAG: SpoIIE family protein phosphatase [Bacteroidia bacterium]